MTIIDQDVHQFDNYVKLFISSSLNNWTQNWVVINRELPYKGDLTNGYCYTFCYGMGLAGLSFVDPAVASHGTLAGAVMVATVLASQAPDADTALRLKDNALYIRNHRGITHSLPFLLLWPALITLVIGPLFGFTDVHSLSHIALWSFIGVAVHVFSDLFNTYGTQAARPFTEKWIAQHYPHL